VNGTTLERPDVAAYLDAVRSRLSDLPAEERDDLVADVEASLLESGEPPKLSPQEFATELREAAGLAPETPAASQPSFLDSLRTWLASERAASLIATARELAPIWWLARAYVAVSLLAIVGGWGWPIGADTANPISMDATVVSFLVAAAVSVWLGLSGRKRGSYRRLSLTVNVALALAAVPVAVTSLDQLVNRTGYVETFVYAEPVAGLAYDGLPVQNLYPYTRDGELLFDVLLFGENGAPISVLSGPDDTSRRVLIDQNGTALFNSFPIRYFDPGTRIVSRPALGPPVIVPDIATPPLVPSKAR
jgi:uncharacterized membrane protein